MPLESKDDESHAEDEAKKAAARDKLAANRESFLELDES